jgi:ferritin-like metal-binding protein YciE
MKLKTLQDLFALELKVLYSGEKQQMEALPKMAKAADSAQLRSAFDQHLIDTTYHLVRLEEVAQFCGYKLRGRWCKAIRGLIEEGTELIAEDAEESVRDAGLIGTARRIAHYEIAAYRTMCVLAKLLRQGDALKRFAEILDEEIATDAKLSRIAQKQGQYEGC